MPASQSVRSKKRKKSDGTVRLNITSMIDMFTLLVVFLLKNYSSQGQLVTPADGLIIPTSSIEKLASEAVSVKVSRAMIMVENTVVVNEGMYQKVLEQRDFLIEPLYDVLKKHADESKKSAEMFKTEFTGKISIQGDVEIPYNILTRIMYTCGQAGFPAMNLVVYRRE